MLIEALRAGGLLSFPLGSPEVRLGHLDVVVGPNGSGKSNLVDLVDLLRVVGQDQSSTPRRSYNAWYREQLHSGAASPGELEARITRPGLPPLRLAVTIAPSGAGGVDVRTRVTRDVTGAPGAELVGSSEEAQGMEAAGVDEVRELKSRLSGIRILGGLGRWSVSDLELLLLDRLGVRGAADEAVAWARRICPRVAGVFVDDWAGGRDLFLREEGVAAALPFSQWPAGITRLLAMAALLATPTPGSMVCVEEPELGLHPDAAHVVGQMLVQASERVQVLVTTHSDALLSALDDRIGSVLVCEHRGGTRFSRLDARRLRPRLQHASLGHLWRQGEIGGKP